MTRPTLAAAVFATLAFAAAPALAQEANAPERPGADAEPARAVEGPAPVIRSADERLTCRQIADEAAALSADMGGTPSGGGLGEIAKAGAAMLIPGAGLLFAGADALTREERERRQAEALAVQNRWFYLNGLYAGRRCLQGG
ncbi:hypothetical protein [Brevundimonas viscosa]|uniref:Uncharacterized protein n=1 Tax=Brevundimonas viscosa TaxID=871741 RepID=A0A1I6QE30_9CAUL|nr:hypothetical protein [Brevundimonas viscosa]SFS50737.1 hypothetical protein SAMN05192570_1737 [Brevundimonas viscosa]